MRDYNRLAVVLKEKKKSNKDIAILLKIQPTTVSRWANNVNQPNIQTLFLIAEYLEVTPGYLLDNKVEWRTTD